MWGGAFRAAPSFPSCTGGGERVWAHNQVMAKRLFVLLAFLVGTVVGAQQAEEIRSLVEQIKATQDKSQGELLSRLGAIGDPAIDALAGLADGADRPLAFGALQELVRIKSPRVLPLLVKKLDVAEGTPRATLLLAIGNHGSPKAYETILPNLANKESNVRTCAAYALGKIGVPDAIPHLEKLSNDNDRSVRWQAKESVKWIRSMVAKFPDRLKTKGWWD